MSILGTGVDIIEVARVATAYERFGKRFLERVLRPDEIEYCLSHKEPGPFLAARFAAKEAISKAFGTGIGQALGWQDMEVVREPSGKPRVVMHDKGQVLMGEHQADEVHLSLSHTNIHAVAMAILERREMTAADDSVKEPPVT